MPNKEFHEKGSKRNKTDNKNRKEKLLAKCKEAPKETLHEHYKEMI